MHKRFTRDSQNSMIAGVCSGIGNYFELDPVIVRILFVLGALFGAGVLVYIVCLIFMSKS